MEKDYFQEALHTFNGANWYGWKTHDDEGNKMMTKLGEEFDKTYRQFSATALDLHD